MLVNRGLLVALLAVSAGCSSTRPSASPVAADQHAIIKTLSTRDRNAVHVALSTLSTDKFPIARKINLNSSYSEAQPGIQAIIDQLRNLPEPKLEALDKSLASHWQLYSPIWSSHNWP
jgi:hypothetical protein